jgi:hypothetical protein
MKSRARFSVLVVFLALLCFAPCAVGQNVTVAGSSVLNHAPFAFLTSAFGPGGSVVVRAATEGGAGSLEAVTTKTKVAGLPLPLRFPRVERL